MRSRFKALVEHLLPWYDPMLERARNRRTEAIRVHSIAKRAEAKQAVDDWVAFDQERTRR